MREGDVEGSKVLSSVECAGLGDVVLSKILYLRRVVVLCNKLVIQVTEVWLL